MFPLKSCVRKWRGWPERPCKTMQSLVLFLLRFYKRWISLLLPSACRFEPTCSEYMMEAVTKYGALRGVWLGFKRVLRCQPFCEGGYDPVR